MLTREIEYKGCRVVCTQSGTSLWGWTFDWNDEKLALAPPDFAAMAEILNHGDPPLRTLLVDDAWYERIDLGVRFAVRSLHAAGFETGQSCEGGEGHAYHAPTIDLPGEAWGAAEALAANGISVASVSQVWPMGPTGPLEMFWRIELRKAAPERANERPVFVWGYQATRETGGESR